MDGIDYTPPTRQEREFLDWAMDKVRANRNADKSDRERDERPMDDSMNQARKDK